MPGGTALLAGSVTAGFNVECELFMSVILFLGSIKADEAPGLPIAASTIVPRECRFNLLGWVFGTRGRTKDGTRSAVG